MREELTAVAQGKLQFTRTINTLGREGSFGQFEFCNYGLLRISIRGELLDPVGGYAMHNTPPPSVVQVHFKKINRSMAQSVAQHAALRWQSFLLWLSY